MDENNKKNTTSARGESAGQDYQVHAPSISLPKGGGAIRGIGEKFSANPVTGTGSMSVPIAASPGRGGFGPQLALSYDSGAGNGSFGLGWNLGLPSISRKTDKGLPRYDDTAESDVFLISGAEDLVPHTDQPEPFTISGITYNIRRYRPRIEGLFAIIERWRNIDNAVETFWRTISKDNVTTWYGKTAESRIANPKDLTQIFSWLICESHDDKGNVMAYCYKAENTDDLDRSQAHELNRTDDNITANRYLKAIRYGNHVPYFPDIAQQGPTQRPPKAELADVASNDWMFELVFDYGSNTTPPNTPADTFNWLRRFDPFSSYRAGFEVRSYRRCQRVLMFHHFPDEADFGANYLVRETRLIYATEPDLHNPQHPGYSVLASVEQHSYQRNSATNNYESRQLPPVEFEYSQPIINETIQEIAPEYLENLPVGLQGSGYQWIDLDGEGLSGVLTEQGGGWFYKANLGDGHFGALRQVAAKPSLAALNAGRQQLMDLAGDGELDLVDFHGPTPGFYERSFDDNWKSFVPFKSLPNIDWNDPNLRFLDLSGDGFADALITEQQVFTWYPSLAEEGFSAAQHVYQPINEDAGPHLVFAETTQSIFLADISGDGLTDLVRIRNGEICYWPNLGYGRFGTKVTLDGSPWFDHPDLFDPHRIRLADIDGSGPVDLIYLGREGAQLYFNRSGNSLSNARVINFPLATENLSAVQVADLLGNGTACLVWNSHLPADAGHPVRYIDLMGSTRQVTKNEIPKNHEKPHLLIRTINNLGGSTEIEYTPSTRFYIQDKLAGTPWVTRLPFPVHCVSKVTAKDQWRGTAFSSTYSYHHGYFDGAEREFRGFGRVEQIDIEAYGTFQDGNIASPYITADKQLYQPPIKSITWYHTGAAIDRKRILTQFAAEYFPQRCADRLQTASFQEKSLPEPELPANLKADEWCEALRACKGMVLRQEVYELDIDDLTAKPSKQSPVRLYSAATHNCNIQRLQPRGDNRHAVFLVTESEAISYHHELDLRGNSALNPDPRIAHTLNLRHDEYGNPQQSVSIGYPRIGSDLPQNLPADATRDALILQVQSESHLAYSETRYTADCIIPVDLANSKSPVKHRRLRLPCEVLSYELKGIEKSAALYFSLSDLRQYDLSETYGHEDGVTSPPMPVGPKQCHEFADGSSAQKRIVEHARSLYFDDSDDISQPSQPLRFGEHGPRGLKYEDYKLALTNELLDAVFQQRDPVSGAVIDDKLAWNVTSNKTARQHLDEPTPQNPDYLKSGYILGSGIDPVLTGQYWMRSGIAGFSTDANAHFYLPEQYTDPFDNKTTLQYGNYDLFVQSSQDAMGNTASVERFDYRVLAPLEMIDANGNHSEIAVDILGLPVAAAIKGKEISPNSNDWQADDLNDFDFALCNPPPQAIRDFCTNTVMNDTLSTTWLGHATTRFIYHFGEKNGLWAQCPPGACSIAREQHKNPASLLQVSLECSDGSGNVLMKKLQAEPEQTNGPPQWIINGLTVLNNKGKPVKQYEPSFSLIGFGCEIPPEHGVTPVIYYDAAGRTIRTEMPDGTFSRVEFSPWHVLTFDANDTVLESQWYADRNPLPHDQPLPRSPLTNQLQASPDQRAAWLAAQHANTPALTILDSLGREVIAIAHNRTPDANGQWKDEHYLTFTKLDAEGKPLWIRDARGNLVMQYLTPTKATRWIDESNESIPSRLDPASGKTIYSAPAYDIAGNLFYQHSMDAGDRWMITDAAGKPMLAWDSNDKGTGTPVQRRLYRTEYDSLHRPTIQWLRLDNAAPAIIEAFEYCDTLQPSGANDVTDAQDRNLIGQAVVHWDPSGKATVERIDLSGKPAHITRTLIKPDGSDVNGVVDWSQDRTGLLDVETFQQITEYDALGRMTKLYNWHRDITLAPNGSQQPTLGTTNRVSVYVPSYNERGALTSEWLHVRATKTTDQDGRISHTADTHRSKQAIKLITYNAKGQKEALDLGNGTRTTYTYDKKTFRLTTLQTRRGAALLQDLSYTYDPVGNITQLNDTAQDTVWTHNTEVRSEHLYQYDALYRLIEACGRENPNAPAPPPNREGAWPQGQFPASDVPRNYTQSYLYDAVGNFLEMRHEPSNGNGWTRHYTTRPDSNRLDQTWYGSNIVDAVTYRHDSHGNMLNMNRTPEGWGLDLQWDWRDMLLGFDAIGGGIATYHYSIDKQRSRKYIVRNPGAGGTFSEDRIYLGGYELYRRCNPAGDVVEEIESLHLFEGEQRVLLVDDVITSGSGRFDGLTVREQTLFRYQYGNHLGSVGLELDDGAQIISYEEFHPYGTSAYRLMQRGIETPPRRYRYTGTERDEESGLGYHGARQYLPCLGRWLSKDPIQSTGNNNLYIYANNNPILFFDLNGKQAMPGNPDQILAYQKVATQVDKKYHAGQVFLTPNDSTPVIRMMPDGTFYMGGKSDAAREYENIEWQLYSERTQKTLANIRGGIWGAVGYLRRGDDGSDVGAILDQALMIFSPHPLNTQQVVNAPTNYVWGAQTHMRANQQVDGSFPLPSGYASAEVSSVLMSPTSASISGIRDLATKDISFLNRLYLRFWKHSTLISDLKAGDVVAGRGTMSARLLGELTAATGRELTLFRRASDNVRLLRLGGPTSVSSQDASRIIAHSHTSGVLEFSWNYRDGKSVGDIEILTRLNQRSSVLIGPTGKAVRLRVDPGNVEDVMRLLEP